MTRKIKLRWGLDENEKIELLTKKYNFRPSDVRNFNKSQLKKILLMMNGR